MPTAKPDPNRSAPGASPGSPKDVVLFDVLPNRTIVLADPPPPVVRADFFGLSMHDLDDPDALADEVDVCPPLRWCVEATYENHRAALLSRTQALAKAAGEPDAAVKRKVDAVARAWPPAEDDPDIVATWIRDVDDNTFATLRTTVKKWLTSPPDHDEESHYFADAPAGQAAAVAFFRDLNDEDLEAMGIVVTEAGETESGYATAELLGEVDAANAAAEELGIALRLRAAA
jgi:hypothetical protein